VPLPSAGVLPRGKADGGKVLQQLSGQSFLALDDFTESHTDEMVAACILFGVCVAHEPVTGVGVQQGIPDAREVLARLRKVMIMESQIDQSEASIRSSMQLTSGLVECQAQQFYVDMCCDCQVPSVVTVTGNSIRQLRLDLGLSRAHLARFLGVSEATVVRWESQAAITEPRGLQAVLLRTLQDAASSHPREQIGRLVRSCGVDHRMALRTLLDAAS
jgi:DNA-binding transcriptional regulator YiaG